VCACLCACVRVRVCVCVRELSARARVTHWRPGSRFDSVLNLLSSPSYNTSNSSAASGSTWASPPSQCNAYDSISAPPLDAGGDHLIVMLFRCLPDNAISVGLEGTVCFVVHSVHALNSLGIVLRKTRTRKLYVVPGIKSSACHSVTVPTAVTLALPPPPSFVSSSNLKSSPNGGPSPGSGKLQRRLAEHGVTSTTSGAVDHGWWLW
jgi:hypothetical protein